MAIAITEKPKLKDRMRRPRRSFYRTLTFYIALAAILPILVLGTLSYYNVKKALENEMHAWSRHVLDNSKEAFEIIINQIFYQASYLTASSTTKDYEDVFNAVSYESMSVNKFNQDLNGLNEYLFFKKNMIKMMSSLRMNNKYIDDIYYYDDEKDMILTSDGLQYAKQKFHDLAWLEPVKNGSDMFTRMDLRTVNEDGMAKNVVTLIYRTFNKNNAFIVNVNINELYTSTIRTMSAGRDGYYLFSKDGNVIVSSTGPNPNVDLDGVVRVIRGDPGSIVYGGNSLLTWVHSDKLGWTFVSLKDLQAYYGNVQRSTNLIGLTCVLLLLVIAGLSPYVSRRLYSPVRKLIQAIKQRSAFAETNKVYDDIGFIESNFETMYNEKFYLQNKFNDHLPTLQTMFKHELIKYGLYGKGEIETKLRDLGLHIPQCDLVLVSVQAENPQKAGRTPSFKEKRVQSLYVQDQLEEAFAGYLGFSTEIDDRLCFVVNVQRAGWNECLAKLQDAKETMTRESGLSLTIGVGSYCEDIVNLNKAYNEAVEAIKYRLAYGNDQIILFDDLRISSKNSYSYPVEKEKALNNCIITGDYDSAASILRTMVGEFTDPKHALSHTRLQQTVQMLLSSIIKTIDVLGIDTDDIFESDTDWYEKLLHKTNKDSLFDTLSSLVSDIIRYVSVEKTTKQSKDVQKIVAFIDEHYTRDISLVDVADFAGFNPSYVSRLLKNGIGRSFTDYVTEKRIAHAERLLVTTEMKLDDISEAVGYNNTYYFIKVFRKWYGTTPSKYRQAQSESGEKRAK
ncbi:AraC family transcriptional regulator [Paenibacillus contaminans]|uniref:HTH araC/xylS-type domain-containing protein n=1 Tax=Paenibacillus contaminans TaxID=450362 RepID=A0A329MR59_9BACL|nr:helix-turn-helix domain-containing protein [Paenibacillus contaminans]RAV22449.1 hypothetical protein DQG23_05785 [Paenibacillus contaminans]